MVLKFSYIMAAVEQKMKSSSVANSDVATKQALRSCLVYLQGKYTHLHKNWNWVHNCNNEHSCYM